MFGFIACVGINVLIFLGVNFFLEKRGHGVLTQVLLYVAIAIPVDMLISNAVANAAIRPFKVEDLYIHAKQFTPNGFSPYMINGSELNKEIDLHFNTDLFKYFYLNNMIWSLTDQSQFRWVGWNYQIGSRVLPFLDIEYEHFSRHILDKANPYNNLFYARFPVEDSIGIKLYLIRSGAKDSLF